MTRIHKVQAKRKASIPFKASDRQTLGDRIRWLRARSNPYMTVKQLSTLTGIKEERLHAIENSHPDFINLQLQTLKRIAHALDCKIFINLKRQAYPLSEECLPLGHDLPPVPKLKRKWTEKGHRLAEVHGSYPWKNYRQRKRRKPPTKTSDTPASSDQAALDVAE